MICNWNYANWNLGKKCSIKKDITRQLCLTLLTDNIFGEDSTPKTLCEFKLNAIKKMDNIKHIKKFL